MGKRVIRTDLPKASGLWRCVAVGDFMDCYSVPCTLAPREAARRAFVFPRWVKALLAVRNILGRPFGLKPGVSGTDRIGFFPVTQENADEII
ncbi:MAG: DUF2867 domain-containing protein, partial [Deltaproteobacteria bacterium]